MLPEKHSKLSAKMAVSEKPFIIPMFIPHAGCPHLCAFCNQNTITGTPAQIPSADMFRTQIETFLGYKKPDRKNVEIAFYGGNFLGLPREQIRNLLKEASYFIEQGRVGGIRFSTRPDTITDNSIDILKDFPISAVEIGAQSMDDEVLSLSLRGHSASDTQRAATLLHRRGYVIGIQMMVGLPGDNDAKAMETGRKIAALMPAFVRIYPAIVIKGSLLHRWYELGKYTPLSLEHAVRLVKQLYLLFKEKNIAVIRMGLQASADLEPGVSIIAGPYHPAFGHLVLSEIFLDKAASIMVSADVSGKDISIRVHPKNVSRMGGICNQNIIALKEQFRMASLAIIPDDSLCYEEVNIRERRE
jgi:histone acetyltransferase (RNA polymerase elongator complex component)